MRTITKVELSLVEVAKLLAHSLELNCRGGLELRVIPETSGIQDIPDSSYHFILEVENDT